MIKKRLKLYFLLSKSVILNNFNSIIDNSCKDIIEKDKDSFG